MSVNIIGGRPNVAIAKLSGTFLEVGLATSNINIIYEVGNSLKSWIPTRSINSLQSITAGQGYYIVPKIDMDLTEWLAPPLETSVGGATQLVAPVLSAISSTDTTIVLNWTNTANETGYELQRSPNGTAWTTINSPAADVISFNDTGRITYNIYYYRVRAIANGTTETTSNWSNVISAIAAQTIDDLSDIPGLAYDFDFSTATDNGGKVSSITDSVNGLLSENNNGGGGGPTQPGYIADGGVNNLPYARFQNQQNLTGGLLTSDTDLDFTVFAIRRLRSNTGENCWFATGRPYGYGLADYINGQTMGAYFPNQTGLSTWTKSTLNRWELVSVSHAQADSPKNAIYNINGINHIHEPLNAAVVVSANGTHTIGYGTGGGVDVDIQRIFGWNRKLTQAEIKKVGNFISDTLNVELPDVVIFEGDSISALTAPSSFSFGLRDALIEDGEDVFVRAVAVPGSVTSQIVERLTTDGGGGSNTMPANLLATKDPRVKNIVVVMIGHNNIGSGALVDDMWNDLTTFCNTLVDNGFLVLVQTTIISTNETTDSVKMDKLLDFNNRIRTQWNTVLHATAMFDTYNIAQALDPTNTTYYSDGTHPTAILNGIIRDALKPEIVALLAA